jgi:hypothetical protein
MICMAWNDKKKQLNSDRSLAQAVLPGVVGAKLLSWGSDLIGWCLVVW